MATCTFLGHRVIDKNNELINNLKNKIEFLITTKNVTKFLFGSRSEFDSLCYDIVTLLKKNIKGLKEFMYVLMIMK